MWSELDRMVAIAEHSGWRKHVKTDQKKMALEDELDVLEIS